MSISASIGDAVDRQQYVTIRFDPLNRFRVSGPLKILVCLISLKVIQVTILAEKWAFGSKNRSLGDLESPNKAR
jgi:hypothetical protein